MSPISRPRRTKKPTLRLLETQASAKWDQITRPPAKRTSGGPNPIQQSARLRRSKRIAALPAIQQAANNKRQSKGKTLRGPQDDFSQTLLKATIASIYREINAYTARDESQFWTPKEQKILNQEKNTISKVSRQARMLQALGQIPAKRRPALQRRLKSIGSRRPDAMDAAAIGDADCSLPTVVKLRLQSFSKHANLLLLSVCAHSQTFRNELYRTDVDGTGKSPEWSHLFDMIKANASSLELFAEVRGLPWRQAVEMSNDHFRLLLDNVFTGRSSISNTTQPDNFGIQSQDLLQIHHVGRHKSQGSWVLPGGRSPARRNRATITMTKEILPEYKAAQPNLKVGSSLDVDQEDIVESILLPGYKYPEWLKPQDGRQEVDPRVCGELGDACWACGKKATPKSIRDKTRPCKCTLEGVRTSQEQDPSVLFELVQTERMGTGIRALQYIEPRSFIGDYLGEIYPAQEEEEDVPARYGHGLYMMDAPISDGPKKPKSMYKIDSAVRGNWTRYINHSCKPNTAYVVLNVGHRQAIAIKALRAIRFGDELTVNYGKVYFRNVDFGCKCGFARCKLWMERSAQRTSTDLYEAKLRGIAPSWAMDDDCVPFDAPIAAKTGVKRRADDDGRDRGGKRQRRS